METNGPHAGRFKNFLVGSEKKDCQLVVRLRGEDERGAILSAWEYFEPDAINAGLWVRRI